MRNTRSQKKKIKPALETAPAPEKPALETAPAPNSFSTTVKDSDVTITIKKGFNTFEQIESAFEGFDILLTKGGLHGARIVNSFAEVLITAWYDEQVKSVIEECPLNSNKEFCEKAWMIPEIRDIKLKKICKNYNIVADQYIKKGDIEQAKSIYKKVLRDFDDKEFQSCYREEELSLMDLVK